MTSLNISLPEPLKQYVERQVASGDWETPSEYVRELIRQDSRLIGNQWYIATHIKDVTP
jgi:antitoxin ParD1/3/4